MEGAGTCNSRFTGNGDSLSKKPYGFFSSSWSDDQSDVGEPWPSRALSKIMSSKRRKKSFIPIETVLTNKKQNDEILLYRDPEYYETNMRAWLQLGGDTPIEKVEVKPLSF